MKSTLFIFGTILALLFALSYVEACTASISTNGCLSDIEAGSLGINLSNGIAAYWAFEETTGTQTKDYVDGNNLSIASINVTLNVAGIILKAFKYNHTVNSNLFDPDGFPHTGNGTISLWIKPYVNLGQTNQGIFTNKNPDANGGLRMYANGSGFLCFETYGSLAKCTAISDWSNTWTFLVLTWENVTNTTNLYVNGTFVDTSINARKPTGQTLELGNYNNSWSSGFNGTIDEVGKWNRTLGVAEIDFLFNNGTGIPFTELNYTIVFKSESHNATSLEYSPQLFNITVVNTTRINATLYYDGSPFTSGMSWVTNTSNWTTFTITINTTGSSSQVQNKSFYWAFHDLLYGLDLTSDNYYQDVYKMIIQTDTSGGAINTFNYSCYDASTSVPLTCSISATYHLWNPINYGNSAYRSQVLALEDDDTYALYRWPPPNVTSTIKYDASFIVSSPGYLTLYPTQTGYNSYANGTAITYYFNLSSVANALYVTFQVVNGISKAPIEGAFVNLTYVNVTEVTACSETTDSAGTVLCLLDSTKTYVINVSATGYPIFYGTITPSQTLYIISLGGTEYPSNDTFSGVSYTILPSDLLLLNGTSYKFWFNITSNYNHLQAYGFNITNGTFTYTSQSGSNEHGSNLTATLNTGSNSTFYMIYWWKINDDTVYLTRTWGIQYNYQGNYSIKTAFDDIRSFANRPEFGGTGSFTLMLIAFFIILISVGAVSVISGGINPISVGLTIVSETWLFYWLGLIPSFPAPGLFANLIPITITVLFIAYIIWEAVR